MLLMEPSALKHWIVAGISLDKTRGSTEIMPVDSKLVAEPFKYLAT
jgi:hypothetical protein